MGGNSRKDSKGNGVHEEEATGDDSCDDFSEDSFNTSIKDDELSSNLNVSSLSLKELPTDEEDEPAALKKVSGKAFQTMGLSANILKAILRKGYRLPSPIQRISIPLILSGKDIAGMARTGSGKTAAFVIPMVQLLKCHSMKIGARALIISPSRELAQQTFKFVKDFSSLTDLRTCLIIGGENLENQFSAIVGNPDILIATPGRLMHLKIEMGLKFDSVEYVVFDEADRLFEMGFSVQLHEILHSLPTKRQTLLFSATLPSVLADFARAGLSNPLLVRLDADFSISKDLQTFLFKALNETRDSILISIFKNFIDQNRELTIVFVPTKHFAEYINLLLNLEGIKSTCVYGSQDQSTRTSRIGMFRSGKIRVLVVTDVASRGLDIPLLDNVINYTLPGTSKLFVHRVGRVARAGKKGTTYSIASPSEMPYILDLQLFTGRSLCIHQKQKELDPTSQIVYSSVPEMEVGFNTERINRILETNVDLFTAKNSALNSYKKYLKSVPPPSGDSIAKAKELLRITPCPLPVYNSLDSDSTSSERSKIMTSISNFRPQETILEITSKGKTVSSVRKIRQSFSEKVKKHKKEPELIEKPQRSEDFISYTPKDHNTSKGYSLSGVSSFTESSNSIIMGFKDEENNSSRKVWDSKKHNFVSLNRDKKLVKSESGAMVPISFKSGRFETWKNKTKTCIQRIGETEKMGVAKQGIEQMKILNRRNKRLYPKKTIPNKEAREELKSIPQVVKDRIKKEKKQRNLKSRNKPRGMKASSRPKGAKSSRIKNYKA